MDWARFRQQWPVWPRAQRIKLARQAGRQLHALWIGKDDLFRLPPARWRLYLSGQGDLRFEPVEQFRHALPIKLTSGQVIEILAIWLTSSAGLADRREQLAFARAFFQFEMVDRHAFRHALAEVVRVARSEARGLARTLYANHFKQRRVEGALAGWSCDEQESLRQLRDQIIRIESDPSTVWIKRRLPTRLFLGQLYGRQVVIKRHDLRTNWERLRYRFRASRARRSCAASLTLLDLGLRTPEPLAYLEVSRNCSYIVIEWLPHVHSVRAWIRSRHQKWSAMDWSTFRRELMAFYRTPYERGFYHDDTKALNILLDPSAAPGSRLWWIDVEGVIPGARLTRYRVLRNLVQLNGSLRRWVPEAERFAFLHDIAWDFPWLHQPSVGKKLRAWTRRRLQREARRQCGP